MKKLFLILFVSLLFVSCNDQNGNNYFLGDYNSIPAQEWFDKYIKHTTITDSLGHTLILHERGDRGSRFYSFSIEHTPECRKCCEIYN